MNTGGSRRLVRDGSGDLPCSGQAGLIGAARAPLSAVRSDGEPPNRQRSEIERVRERRHGGGAGSERRRAVEGHDEGGGERAKEIWWVGWRSVLIGIEGENFRVIESAGETPCHT